ncbi:MAG: exo-alpha-sialidase, partial [Opitutaceae bacterium]
AIARSLDGGVTWLIEPFAAPDGEPRPAAGGIDFTHPGFALHVRDGAFYYSHDRARTWRGPFAFPDFKLGDRLTSRTDYIVNSARDCLIFLSVRDEKVQSGIPDRAFAVRTRDGGKTFEFLGWMTGSEPPVARSVMPATVRAADGTLVTLLRRRFDLESSYRNDLNWLDAFTSLDDGVTWAHAARIAHTDHAGRNGNPPSLVKLFDGRLVAVYGVRSKPFGIRARVSRDNGLEWGSELVLRDDARTWDIGYCRSIVRSDGRIVTVYYYATNDHFENHIAATIWSPPEARSDR